MNSIYKLLVLGCIIVSVPIAIYASFKPNVEIKGTNKITAVQVQRKFHGEFAAINSAIFTNKGLVTIDKNMKAIVDGVKQMGNFGDVHLNSVVYPKKNAIYFTLEVADKDILKMKFKQDPVKNIPDPDNLIKIWQQYEAKGTALLLQGVQLNEMQCNYLHCLFGFNHLILKTYEKIFSQKVALNKDALISVLLQDKNPKKRAAAVYLLAHTNDAQELTSILSKAIDDSDQAVRNNTLRVLGYMLLHTRVTGFPIDKIIVALEYPAVTDTNKALFVLWAWLKQNPLKKNYLIEQCGDHILQALKSKQPNIHELSYRLLLELSAKRYSEHDISAWRSWLKSARKSK